VEKFLLNQGVKTQIALTHHAETDGLAERAIQTLTKKLRRYVESNKNKSLPQCLTAVTKSVHNSINRLTNYAPIEIMEQEFPETKFSSPMKIETPTNEFYKEVYQNTQRYTDNMRKKEQEKRDEPTRKYEIGELVHVCSQHKKPNGPTKFERRYDGPYEITQKLS
jgi:type VI protein secretion system component VasK